MSLSISYLNSFPLFLGFLIQLLYAFIESFRILSIFPYSTFPMRELPFFKRSLNAIHSFIYCCDGLPFSCHVCCSFYFDNSRFGALPVLFLEGVSKCTHSLFYAQSPDFLKPGLCYFLKFLYL